MTNTTDTLLPVVKDAPVLRDLGAPVAALALLMAGHPSLPSPSNLSIHELFPDELELNFHQAPGRWETWVAALGADLSQAEERPACSTSGRFRRVAVAYGGARIVLCDYGVRGGDAR